ncbi:MAG: ATP-binding protein [Bryobacteraceae bacterium]|nr:ATP-binding protein [Bryobacteraceae bacterium]MDW8378215.1 ATP-binding protein [Bryobacterales bacterium]
MHITRLLVRGVGPFEHLDLNFSSADGLPDLGPHLLVGASGSGKTAAVRALAWVLAGTEGYGFPLSEFRSTLAGHRTSTAAVILSNRNGVQEIQLAGRGAEDIAGHALWLNNALGQLRMPYQAAVRGYLHAGEAFLWASSREVVNVRYPVRGAASRPFAAAYAARPTLKYLHDPRSAAEQETLNTALSFEATVANAAVQSWLVSIFT